MLIPFAGRPSRFVTPVCALLLGALTCSVIAAADAPAATPVGTDPAVKIAAALIEERAHAAATVGDLVVAGQLENLARGLLDHSISLADAAQVMVIAGESRGPAPVATPPSPQARAAASHVAALIDGTPDAGHPAADPATTVAPSAVPVTDAPAPPSDSPPAPAPAPPAMLARPAPAPDTADAPGPTADAPRATPPAAPISTGNATSAAVARGIHTKVYAVNVDQNGKVSTAIIGAGGRNGVLVNDRFVITRGSRTIAQVIVVKVDDAQALSFTEVVPGSMPDPHDEVKEGDEAASWP